MNNPSYNVLRRDRDSNGGGLLVFTRKEYEIHQSILSNDFVTALFSTGTSNTKSEVHRHL
jgi:hypothetical protein